MEEVKHAVEIFGTAPVPILFMEQNKENPDQNCKWKSNKASFEILQLVQGPLKNPERFRWHVNAHYSLMKEAEKRFALFNKLY